jgi:hypothetical protein
MIKFASGAPSAALDVIRILKSSSDQKLSCSPYNGNKPGSLPQQDHANWNAFQAATETGSEYHILMLACGLNSNSRVRRVITDPEEEVLRYVR